MALSRPNLLKRNQKVLDAFRRIKTKNPKWRTECVIDEVANEMCISSITVGRILKNPFPEEKTPAVVNLCFNFG